MAQLTYGVKEGRLHHINDVEQGLNCNCICPNCNEKLIARHGKINEHHFAHVAKECDITVAQETALHIMAKEILEEYKIIKLPKFQMYSKTAFLPKKQYKEINDKIDKDNLIYFFEPVGQEEVIQFDNVYLEQQVKGIVPDLICEYGNKKLFIEIAVTNFITETKQDKIKNLDIATIEIDLSSYKDRIETMTKRRLSDILIDDLELKKWIYHPNYNEQINKIKQENIKEIKYQTDKIEYCMSMFYPENYIVNQHIYRDDKHTMNFWNKQKISQKMTIPSYVGVHIYGDFIFRLDRRIWQSFILNLIAFSKYPTTPSSLWKYMKDKEFLKINPDFIEPMWISNDMKFSGYNVVEQYYNYLHSINIINDNGLLNE